MEQTQPLKPLMYLDNFQRRLALARRGEKIIYHQGYLPWDRVQGSRYAKEHRAVISSVANFAYGMYTLGKVLLVQKRHGDYMYDYIAVIL